MKKLYLLLIFIALAGYGFGQGLENFDNSNATASYTTNSFVGEGGITWNYVASRNGNGDNNSSGISLPALMLRRVSDVSKVYSGTISGGIGDFSVKLYKGFTGGGSRQVELFINGVSKGESTVFDDYNEHVFTVSDIDVAGDIVIRIDNITANQVIIDDITWTSHSGGGGNDNDTEVTSGTQPSAASISSLADSDGEAVEMLQMVITDQGTADGLATKVTKIRVKPHTSNTADWTDHIQGIKLNDGSDITIGTVVITDTYIDIPITSGNLDIADGGSETVTMSVYLNTSNILDESILAFMVDADSHGFTSDVAGSGFATTFSGGDFNSNNFTIGVAATKFSYNQQPSNTNVDDAMTPAVLVAFTDANGNTDKGENGTGSTITLTTTATFSGSATIAVDAVNGVATFDNLKFSGVVTEKTITAIDTDLGELSSLISNTFDIVNEPKVIISAMCDPYNDYRINRYIQIYNASSSTVDLSSWSVVAVAGASDAFTWDLSGNIKPGEVKTCGDTDNSKFTPDFAEAGWSGANSGWNGKTGDGAKLLNGVTIVDDASSHGNFENKVANRNSNIITPVTVFSSSQWTSTAVDNCDDSPSVPTNHICDAPVFSLSTGNWSTLTSSYGNGTNYTVDGSVVVDEAISNPALANNITISTGNDLTISVGKGLTINGTLTNNAGNNGIVIESTSAGNGSLITTSNPSATVKRYIAEYIGDGDGWHTISSPVNAMTIAGSDFVPTADEDDLYAWDEDDYTWRNYLGGSFPGTTFVNGKGYLAAYKTTSTKSFTGTLNTADITFANLSLTSGKGEGWHLLGNPFPSAIKWNGDVSWSLTNVTAIAKIYNEDAGNYLEITANEIIPSTNGFFIEVTVDADNAITIPAAAKEHDATNNYKATEIAMEETLKLTVSNDENTFYDVTRVAFNADAKNAFDWNFDSHKMYGQSTAPQLWTVIEGEEFSTNTLPYIASDVVLPLNFKAGVNTTYHINAEGLESFFGSSDIYLEDKTMETMINLRDQSVYSFQAQTDDATDRFQLHFYGVNSTQEIEDANTPKIYAYNNTVNILFKDSSLDNINVKVFNAMGQKVYSTSLHSGENSFKLNEKTGVYIIQVQNAKGVSSQKIMIK